MGIEYKINVAKCIRKEPPCYRHYFQVGVPFGKVKEVFEEIKRAFPDCKLEITRWETIGKQIDVKEIDF